MKILKKILLAIVGIIALLLIIALFVGKDYAVEREITINKPKQQVFEYVKYVKNQDNFSKWNKMDPNSKKEFTGTDGTVGFIYAWDSEVKNVGKGEQVIMKIDDGNRIDFDLRFKKPMEMTDHAYLATETVSDSQTKVKWGFYGKMPYPMNLLLLCINFDKQLGPDLATGLTNLKEVLEK